MRKRKSRAHHDPSEAAFLADYDASAFPHPSVTVDVAVITPSGQRLHALMLKRSEQPQKDAWSLPGGFVGMDESLEQAAVRVLAEKAGLKDVFLEQLFTFGAPMRDPRTRVITVAYYALVDEERLKSVESRALRQVDLHVPWPGEQGGAIEARDGKGKTLRVAFDHAEILGMVVQRLRGKLDYAPIGFELLPEEFSLRALQNIHETIRGEKVNKDSFRRRMLATGRLKATGKKEAAVGHRPAELYRFEKNM